MRCKELEVGLEEVRSRKDAIEATIALRELQYQDGGVQIRKGKSQGCVLKLVGVDSRR